MSLTITESELALFTRVAELIKKVVEAREPDLLSTPLLDWCDFVATTKPGDKMTKFLCSTIAALQITGFILPKEATHHMKELAKLGVFPAWEKETIFNRVKGKSRLLDEWFETQLKTPGDLVGTAYEKLVSEIYQEKIPHPVPNIIQ